ncbi:MAG: tyrosine--tRNA ligase [Planctomycetota bacterium]
MKTAYDTLEGRGLIENVTDEAAVRKMLAHKPVTFYVGFDPTADSLHVGHLLPIMAMAHLQRAGHRPIAVVGGGTGMVGDPSGKTELRNLLTPDQIDANLEAQKKQLRHFLKFDTGADNAALMINNADWLEPLNYIEFLRDVGVHFTVNRMLAAECFKQRWEKGLTFIEFNYMLLQAYDFLTLYRREGCALQLGGNDQWGNILAGCDLTRRVEGADVHGLVVPLLLTSGGNKMGKTESGALWLSAEKTSPYDFYQYWRNVDDPDVERCLRMLTFLPMAEVRSLASAEPSPALNESKKRLAFEITALVHGEDAAKKAEAGAAALFDGGGEPAEGIPTLELNSSTLDAGIAIIDAIVVLGLTKTKSDARRLIQQGGAYVNGDRVDSIERTLTTAEIQDGRILIRAGKKKHGRILVE